MIGDRTEERQECKQRDHRHVLEEQHGKGFAPVPRCELLALGERRKDERRGRHCEAESGDQRRLPRKPERERRSSKSDAGDEDLRAPQAEHWPAQHPQAAWLQFESDEEK